VVVLVVPLIVRRVWRPRRPVAQPEAVAAERTLVAQGRARGAAAPGGAAAAAVGGAADARRADDYPVVAVAHPVVPGTCSRTNVPDLSDRLFEARDTWLGSIWAATRPSETYPRAPYGNPAPLFAHRRHSDGAC
jgi:hypothetical protein